MTLITAAQETNLLTGATISTSDDRRVRFIAAKNEAGILASLLILHASPNFKISRPMDYFEFFSAYLCL